MKMIVEISGHFTELESSRVSLAIMRESLIRSLAAQHDRNFRTLYRPHPMDHRYSARLEAIRSVECEGHVCGDLRDVHIAEPFLHVTLPCDICVVSGFTKAVRHVAEKFHSEHSDFSGKFLIPDGVALDGDLYKTAKPEQSGIVIKIRHPAPRMHAEIGWTKSVIWMRPWNYCSEWDRSHLGSEIPEWTVFRHIDESILRRYCSARIATATSAGCVTEWHRSKSMIQARRFRRRFR